MIVAVDFDGTLQIGKDPNLPLIGRLIQMRSRGATIILWTCREGDRLREAVQFCKQYGLKFNFINRNSPEAVRMLGHDPRKIYADVYIDDKCVK